MCMAMRQERVWSVESDTHCEGSEEKRKRREQAGAGRKGRISVPPKFRNYAAGMSVQFRF